MRLLGKGIAAVMLVAVMAVGYQAVAPASQVHAQDVQEAACQKDNTCVLPDNPKKSDKLGIPAIGLTSGVKTVISTLSFIAGALSVFFIVLGGIRYATSSGDATRVANAKNTLLYAIIGLIVSMLAAFVVGFILERTPK